MLRSLLSISTTGSAGKLSRRLPAAFAVIALVTALSVGIFSIVGMMGNVNTEVDSEILRHLESIQTYFSLHKEHVAMDAESVANEGTLKVLVSYSLLTGRVTDYLNKTARMRRIKGFFLLVGYDPLGEDDDRSRILARSEETPEVDRQMIEDMTHRLLTIHKTEKPFSSVHETVNGNIAIFGGAVVAEIETRFFVLYHMRLIDYPTLQDISQIIGVDTALFRGDNSLVMSTSNDFIEIDTERNLLTSFREDMQAIWLNGRKNSYLNIAGCLGKISARMGVSLRTGRYTGKFKDDVKVILLVTLFCIVAATLTGVQIAGNILLPMCQLQQGMLRIRRSGQLNPVEVSGNGDVGMLAASFNEMVVRVKESMRNQLAQQLFLKAVMDASPPIFWKNVLGQYVGCNPAFERMTGLSESAIVGRTSIELFDVTQRNTGGVIDDDGDAKVFRHNQSHQRQISVGVGSCVRHLIITKQAYFSPEGGVVGLVGLVTDVTELVNINRDNEQLKELLAQMLHSSTEKLHMQTRMLNHGNVG